MDEFERWFLVVYLVASIPGLLWAGGDRDERKSQLISGQALRERSGGQQ